MNNRELSAAVTKAFTKLNSSPFLPYIVSVRKKDGSEHIVGRWATQGEANKHKNRLFRNGDYKSVEWQLVK